MEVWLMFDKKTPEQKFTESVNSTKSLRQLIEQTPCPACKQKTLKLSTYTKSKQDWGAAVACQNCNLTGEVNSTGFSYVKVEGKGKARQ